jgi:hypothetical protein
VFVAVATDMDHAHGPIALFAHEDAALLRDAGARRELERPPVVLDDVIGTDDPGALQAEDVGVGQTAAGDNPRPTMASPPAR